MVACSALALAWVVVCIALAEIEDEFGVDLVDDLLRHLDSEHALAAMPDSSGRLGDDQGPVGMVLLAETSDPDRVDDNLKDAVDRLVERAGVESGRERNRTDQNGEEPGWKR